KSTLAATDDVDLVVMERCLDDSDECMWLSSDYFETKSSNSSASSVTTTRAAASEAEDLEDFIAAAAADEPLFWPFAREQDWSSEEAWKCFSMSPRRDMAKVESSGQQFPVRKTNPKAGCSRNKPNRGIISNNKDVKETNAVPSRLRNLNKVSMEVQVVLPLETGNDHAIKPTKGKAAISRSFCVDDVVLNDELPIETVLGLGEFDGHEGIDLDLNEDVFFLDKSSEFSIKY
ncbi:hypothetical protein CISIN_1g043246mg, partial [Citrus sinensis]